MTKISIVDYGMGNIGSLANMIEKVGGNVIIATKPDELSNAEKIILPGVGSFDNGMKKLVDNGFVEILQDKIIKGKVPILAICLGMHLLTKSSEEGTIPGLGMVNARTVRFNFTHLPEIRIPHMGWNDVFVKKKSKLFEGNEEDPIFYFVHSYHVVCEDSESIMATTRYGIDFVSAIEQDNIFATQFHPEKSHKYGMRLMKNFVELV